jgi:hypothetical protein
LAKGRRYSRKRKRYVILLGAMILLLAYPLYQWLSPPSAEEVMYATLRALQVGDVKTLILLTHPEEIRSLNLTPEAVDALLRTGVCVKVTSDRTANPCRRFLARQTCLCGLFQWHSLPISTSLSIRRTTDAGTSR